MASQSPATLRDVFVTGLKNVHGVEHQALALIDRQLGHLASYPEVADMLRVHRTETEEQVKRVDEILDRLGERASALKDTVLSVTGNLAALAHLPAPDEILKNSFANQAFENFEAASYTSLIALAEAGFDDATAALRQSLSEEQRTAQWFADHIPAITLKYVSLRAEGKTASH